MSIRLYQNVKTNDPIQTFPLISLFNYVKSNTEFLKKTGMTYLYETEGTNVFAEVTLCQVNAVSFL